MATITLSSPQRHSDQEIKSKLFNQLLTELREQNGMTHYIWRAEKQQNGNIHFHLVTNTFLNAAKLRQRWNRIQNKLGYVDAYACRMNNTIRTFNDYRQQFSSQGNSSTLRRRYIYGKATNWTDPNSTDIHGTTRITDLYTYLARYLCKNNPDSSGKDETNPLHLFVGGKLWGLSQTLSALKQVTTVVDTFISNDLRKLWDEFAGRIIAKDYYTFIPLTFRDIVRLDCSAILRFIFEKLREIGIHTLILT